jgi:diguanylate cyclase (GGDEF)-like protein
VAPGASASSRATESSAARPAAGKAPGESPSGAEHGELSSALVQAYCAALLTMAKSGAQACPAVSADLQQGLAALAAKLKGQPADAITPDAVREAEKNVNDELQQWGGRTSGYFKTKTNEVKEMLIVLARTAESMMERDQRYAQHFSQFTTQLQTIADLDDLTQVRKAVVLRAKEMKTCVDKMAEESQKSVKALKSEVSTYETKLHAAEALAAQDPLTGLANRRSLEERIEWRIAHNQSFCLVMVDLNKFKQVNDTYGHPTGDDLLQQFARELKSNARSTDYVGRWGGDEFVIVLDGDLAGAEVQIERLRKWIFGDYKLKTQKGEVKVLVEGSVGVTQWKTGQSVQDAIKQTDNAMYKDKKASKLKH